MKKLFLVLFLFVSLFIKSFGANTYELEYVTSANPVSIIRGGDDVLKVRLKITNPAGIPVGSYEFKSDQKTPGLYIKNQVTASGISLSLNAVSNKLTIPVTDNSLTSIVIDMDVWVGQCFPFSALDVTKDVSSPFSIFLNNNVLSLSGNSTITINKGAFLNYLESESVRSSTPDNNKLSTFSYVLVNNSGFVFNGNFSFQESAVQSVYNIQRVNFYKYTSTSGWVLLPMPPSSLPTPANVNPKENKTIGSNDNKFITDQPLTISLNLEAGDKIKVEEIVQLNGCLQNNSTNSSTPLISWGNAEYDMCANLNQLTLKSAIVQVNYRANLVGTNVVGPNHSCYGGNVVQRSYKFTNNSKPASSNEVIDVARNVMIDLFSNNALSPFSIPFVDNNNVTNDNTAIYMTVNGDRYILNLKKYSLVNTTTYTSANLPSYLSIDLAPVWNNSGYGVYANSILNRQGYFFRPVNGIFTLNELITKVANPPSSSDKYPFSTACLDDNNSDKKFIKDLYIDEYKRAGVQYANDPFIPIDIKPGDVVILYWNEVNCCFKNDIVSPDVFSSSVAVQYEDLCVKTKPNYYASRSVSGLQFQPSPSSGTTLGDVDRCTSTSDGLVERISSPILGISYAVNNLTPDMYANRKGRIVFRVYVQNGLDLDKSLAKPTEYTWTHQRGFDNVTDEKIYVTNSASNCKQGECETNPACQIGHMIPDGLMQYYVRLRPTFVAGAPSIVPKCIKRIASDDKVQLQGGLPSNYNPDLVFNENKSYANQLYEISFDVSDLLAYYEANSLTHASTVGGEQGALNQLLFGSIFDFDLRAYCSINGKPSYKVVMYLDKCDALPDLCNGTPQAYASTLSCSPGSGFTTMQPITSFGSSMIVNCPGCLIPGANIEQSFLVRSENSRGLTDLDGDRRPDVPYKSLPADHPTLKKVAMGDEMTATFQCYMSDGADNNTAINQFGIKKSTLDDAAVTLNNDNFYLDNFMVEAQITNAITKGTNKNIDITSLRMKYNGREIFLQEGNADLAKYIYYPDAASFLIRANIKDFYTASETVPKSFGTGSNPEGISFVLTYRIGDMGTTSTTSEITYAPYYTPCDNCNTLVGMTGVNPADNVNMRPFDLTVLAGYNEKTLWKCSGFSNKFKFIPYAQEATLRPYDNNCDKSVELGFTGFFNPSDISQRAADFFEEEFRTFLKSDLKAEILVPLGYKVSGITIVNTIAGGTETFNIIDPTLINSILKTQVPANAEYPQYCQLLMHFENKNPPYNTITPPLKTTYTNVFPDGISKSLTRGDENYSVRITVSYKLDPAMACSSIPPHVFIVGNIWDPNINAMRFANRTNSPTYAFYEDAKPIRANPNVELPQTATYISKYLETSSALSYATPVASLRAGAVANQTLILNTNDFIKIPISITNQDINADPRIPANDANYPYLQIYGDALTKGLELVGVYRIDGSQTTPYYPVLSSSTDLGAKGILVGIDYQNAGVRPATRIPQLRKGEIQQYMLVFKNTCPGACNQNVGCGTENSSLSASNCLVGANNLHIGYGWNCDKYPTFQDLTDKKACGQFNPLVTEPENLTFKPLDYTVNIAPVGLSVNTYDNNNISLGNNQTMEIQPCNASNNYRVRLFSCKEVGFNEFEIEFTGVSSQISITAPTTVGSFKILPDGNNPRLFHLTCITPGCSLANQTIDVDFIIKSSCKVVSENLTTTVRGKTFCTPSAVPYFTLTNPLKMKVDPLTSIADQITLTSQNVTVVNGNQLNINYSLAGAASGVTKFDNGILVTVLKGSTSVYSETIAIPAGTPDGLVNKNLALGIAECGSYTVVLTPQLIIVPPCGIVNGAIIPECKNNINGPAVSKNVLLGSPLIPFITTSDGSASFLCGSGSKVTFVAYPQAPDLTYSWTGPGITTPLTTNQIETILIGTYTVVVTNACGSATAHADAVDRVDIECPEPICPGESPNIVVTNFSGVVGTYKAQWYNPSGTDGNTQVDLADDILMDKGIVTSGYYYAATVTPSCTLRTNARVPEKCPITVKRAPNAYHITSDRPSGDASVLFLCDGQTTVLSVTNKSVNSAFATDVIWRNGQTTTDDIVAPGTWTSPGNLLTAQELEKSSNFIVAIDVETQCRTASNEIAIETPRIGILRSCDDNGGIKLTAVSNFNVQRDQYEWSYNDAFLVAGTNEVQALTQGVYTVKEKSTGCTLTNRCWGISENLNTSALPNLERLTPAEGGFEGITATQVLLGFDTEFSPLDRTGYTGAPLPADYTIGKFMINEAGLQASDWSPNVPSTWVNTNTTYSGTGALFIDGESEPAPKLIWGKTVSVTHGLNYLYRFNVRNINLLTQYPVEEIPELYVQITYVDAAGNGTRYRTNKQALFDNGQNPWIEFSSYTPAIPLSIYDCSNPSEIQTVRLELFMDGGGAIGRDISVDAISLIPIGICDDVASLGLPCNAAVAELDNNQLVICPGSTAQFNIINAPAGLTYQWQSVVGTSLTTVGAASSFVTPELSLTDPLKPAFFDYKVTISDPVNHCQTKLSAKVIVSPLPSVTITNSWTGNNCENEFVATYDGLGTPSQFEWHLNGTLVSGETNSTYIARNLNTGDVVQSNVRNVWCSGTSPVESNIVSITDAGLRADAGIDKTICAGKSVLIGTTSNTGVTYNWAPATDLDDASKAQPVFSPTGTEPSVEFTLTLTDLAKGCVSEDKVTVDINSNPTLVVTDPAAVCAPDAVDITAAQVTQGSTAGLAYTYFSDALATNAVLNASFITLSGTYYIQAENTQGCKIAKPVVVGIKSEAKVVITNPALVHFPSTVDLTLPAITMGSTTGLTYSYFMDHDATTALATPNAVSTAGTYYIKGTTADGCSDIAPVIVSIDHALANKTSVIGMDVLLNPNPFAVHAYMTVSGATSDYVKATIIDMNGKVVFEDARVPNNDITPIGMDLPSAVYILKIIDGEKIKIIKFVKL